MPTQAEIELTLFHFFQVGKTGLNYSYPPDRVNSFIKSKENREKLVNLLRHIANEVEKGEYK